MHDMCDTIQQQSASTPASGRFVLRIDPALHTELREAARNEGISLNELCARKLALPTSGVSGPGVEATASAAAILGDALLGVVAFGSWARGELTDDSDVDLLIVVDGKVKIDRSLYRDWDEEPVFWDGHAVEPHFVHMPRPGIPLSGTWAEVAVEGIVLYDLNTTISSLLVSIRRKIVAGEIVRRRLHGQSYWVEAA